MMGSAAMPFAADSLPYSSLILAWDAPKGNGLRRPSGDANRSALEPHIVGRKGAQLPRSTMELLKSSAQPVF
jgi:hypothetical protein